MINRMLADIGTWVPRGSTRDRGPGRGGPKLPRKSSPTYVTWALRIAVLALVAASLVWTVGREVSAAQVTYYVDCSAGNDNAAGTSTGTAWKSILRANKASLKAGDALLLKRGCVWSQQLRPWWNGTSSDRITIGAYGSGDLPKLQNNTDGNVRISGSYMTIENLQTYNSASSYGSYDPNCPGQPVGWVVGFNFVGASNVTVQNSVATHEAIAVSFTTSSHNNHVLNNQLVNNDGAWKPVAASGGIRGGTGIVLEGTSNEIGNNHFEGNSTHCKAESISVELYQASNSNIHHNTVFEDKVFLEAGSTSGFQSSNNTIAYNVHTSSMDNARFVVTRGSGASYGPVWNTTIFNNSIYYTGSNSQGVICMSCGSNIMRIQNNNLVAVRKAIYIGGGQPIESNNIFWSPSGQPTQNDFVQNLNMSSTSHIENPKYANPGARNLHLQSSSPAINAGTMTSVNDGYSVDLDGVKVPQAGAVDVGSYETGGTASLSTDTSNPTPTPTQDTTSSPAGSSVNLPGVIQAEDYNSGGDGVGYHDTTAANLGGAYRQDAVDIQKCTDPNTPSGETCYNVGWPANGEWLAYDVKVGTTGNFQAKVRVASIYGSAKFHLEVDGKNVTGSVSVPNTGGWQNWTTVTTPSFSISAGTHTFKLVDETTGFNVNYISVTSS